MRWGIVLVVSLGLWAGSALAQSAPEAKAVCQRAAGKLDGLIEDWHALVVEYHAEAKNPSVLKLMAEHRKGRLKPNFQKHCQREWPVHEAIFTCFAGSVTALGLALCHQSDTNPNHWQY